MAPRRRPVGLVEAVGHLLVVAGDRAQHFLHQQRAGAEVAEDGGRRDLGPLGDIGVGGAADAALGEGADRRVEQLLVAIRRWQPPSPRPSVHA